MWVLWPLRSMSATDLPGTRLCYSVSPVFAFVSYPSCIIPTMFWCIQNRCCFQASSWPSFKRVMREPVPLQTFWWHLCRTDFRLQSRHPIPCACETGCCTKHCLCCMRTASSLEINNVHRFCSASGHPLCWMLNMQPAVRVAYKPKRWDRGKVREETEVKWIHLRLNSSSAADCDPLWTPALTSYPLCCTVPLFF